MSLLGVIIVMLLLAVLGAVMVSVVTTERFVGANQAQAASAQYLAEAGLDRALRYYFDQEESCVTVTEAAGGVFNANLGNGSYIVTTDSYAPTALELDVAIDEAVTSFVVDGNVATAGYAPYGIVIIDTEYIECANVAGNRFDNCKRGVGGSEPAVHAAGAQAFQDFCIVNAIGRTQAALAGTAQRVVSVGFSQFDLGWAVGDRGTILQWNGVEWLAAPPITDYNLRAVKLISLSRAWSAGDWGTAGELAGGVWSKNRSAYVYLPVDGGNRIAVFDSDTHEVGQPGRVGYINLVPLGIGGVTEVAMSPNGRYLYMTRSGADNVVVLDADDCTDDPGNCVVEKTIAVGDSPRGLAFSPDGLRLYVVNENSDSLSVICRAGPSPVCGTSETVPANDFVVSTISLDNTVSPGLCTNYTPRYVAVARGGTKAVVTTDTSGCLKFVDLPPAAPAVRGLAIGDTDQWGIAVHPNDYYAYVAGKQTDRLYAIDLINEALVEGLDVGGEPWGIAYTRDGVEAYVSKKNVDRVLALETATNVQVADMDLGTVVGVMDAGPEGMANSADGTAIYAVNVTAGRLNIIHVQDKSAGASENLAVTGALAAAPARGFKSISMLGPSEGWAVGADGRLARWDGTAWLTQPMVDKPVPPLPPDTVNNGDGTWTTTLYPEADAYVRMNDDVGCTPPPPIGCTNGVEYGSPGGEPEKLGLRRVFEDPDAADVNVIGDLTDPANPNQKLYRPYLRFDVSPVRQYALAVLGASLQLAAYDIDLSPPGSDPAGSGLVLQYELDEAAGATAGDASGLNNFGTLRENPPIDGEVVWETTDVGNESDAALRFTGGSGRIVRAPTPSLKLGTAVTVGVWVKFTNAGHLVPGVNRELIRKGVRGATDSRFSYMLGTRDGIPVFTVRVGNNTAIVCPANCYTAVADAPLVVDQWYHLMGTYDDAADLVTVRVGGEIKGAMAVPGASPLFTGGLTPGPPTSPAASNCGGLTSVNLDSLCIGGVTGGGFEGLLDEVRIYGTALTQGQGEEEVGWPPTEVNVHRVLQSWADDAIRGDAQRQISSAIAGSAIMTQSGVPANPQAPPDPDERKWVSWPMTRQVQRWVDDTDPNFGVVLRIGLKGDNKPPGDVVTPPTIPQTDPNPNGIMWFHSADALPPNDVNRPRLVVTYRIGNRPNLEGVAMLNTDGDVAADDGWAVGEAGILFRYDLRVDPANLTWSRWTLADNGNTPLPTQRLMAVAMRSSIEGWAVGDGGAVYHFTGGQWQADLAASGLTNEDLTALSITSGGDGVAVGDNGTVLAYDGTSWSSDPTAAVNLTAVKAFSDSKAWGVGEQGTIIRKRAGAWVAPGQPGTVPPPAVSDTHLRGIDMLPMQTNVTDWRENY